MRISCLVGLLALAACSPATAPQQCFKKGDTVGWITVTKKGTGEVLAREPILAVKDFCV